MLSPIKISVSMNRKAMIPAVVATVAFFLSLYSTLTCQYATLVAPNGYQQSRGIWYLEGYERIEDTNNFKNVCTPYPAVLQMDQAWQFSRTFTLASGITGSAAVAFLWCFTVLHLDRSTWFQIAGACVTSSFLDALVFLFVNSSGCRNSEWVAQSAMRHCNLSRGFGTNVASTILWFITAAVMISHPPHKKKNIKQIWDGQGLEFEKGDNRDSIKEWVNIPPKEAFPVLEILQVKTYPSGGSVGSGVSECGVSEISQSMA